MKVYIENIVAREIYDSRGNPTVEADVFLSDGAFGRASVPSGASTGDREAVELRDGGQRVQGKGVSKAVKNVNGEIRKALLDLDPFNQRDIDGTMIELDGTVNKARLGANALLAVSMANARAAAQSVNLPLYRHLGGVDLTLPLGFYNVINGGQHADSGIDTQEFMIVPVGGQSFRGGFEMIAQTYHTLKANLKKQGLTTAVGDEGGFAPQLGTTEKVLETLVQAIEQAGYRPGEDIAIALDPASSEFYQDGHYHFEGKTLISEEMVAYYEKITKAFPIISIEDGMAEHDWEGFHLLTQRIGERVQLVGDDIFVTNPKIFKEGIERGIGNAILIKLNQIGTVSEAVEAIQLARRHNYGTMVSHRSGETGDTFIADFAVAMAAGQIKTGATARSERIEKYNQLMRIEEALGKGTPLFQF